MRNAFVFAALVFAAVFLGCPAGGVVTSGDDRGGDNFAPPRPVLLTLSLGDSLSLEDFSPEVFEYKVSLPADPVEVCFSMTLADDASVSYLPAEQFSPQNGSVGVVILTDNKTLLTTYYVISFERGDLAEAALSGINLSAGTLGRPFDPAVHEYTAQVPYGVADVTVYAEAPASQGTSYFTYTPQVTVNLSSGEGRVRVGVTAEGYATGRYTIDFTVASARVSTLAGVNVSPGAITDSNGTSKDFNADSQTVQFITVTNSATQLIVNAVKKVPGARVSFSNEDTNSDGVTSVFFAPEGGTLDGVQFYITTNNGTGYQDRQYEFRVRATDKEPALLPDDTGISISGDAMFYSRSQDGSNSGTNFTGTNSFYNILFAHGASSVTVNVSSGGKDVTINGTAGNSKTFTNPKASDPPVIVNVSAADEITTSYSLYWVHANPPPAAITALTVIGGSAARPFSGSDYGPYTIKARSGTSTLFLRPELPDGFSISWNPSNLISPPEDGIVTANTEGGPDFAPCEYKFDVRIVPAELARLKTLVVGGVPVTALNDDKLVYTVRFDYDFSGAPNVPFAWTYDASEVKSAEYSLDLGDTWTQSGSGFSSGVNVAGNSSAVVLLRLKTFDGNMAIYYITVKRDRNPEGAWTLRYNWGNGDIDIPVDGVLSTIEVPSFIDDMDFIGSGNSEKIFSYSPDSGSLQWGAGDFSSKIIVVSIYEAPNTDVYILNVNKKTEAQTRLASGGEVSFVKDGNGVWSEVHKFAYNQQSDSGGQTSYNFEVSNDRSLNGRLLIVAGGGGGGHTSNNNNWAGGGGAGGAIYFGPEAGQTLAGFASKKSGDYYTFQGAYAVKVGKGGAAGTGNGQGGDGKDSQFASLTAKGGGGGGGSNAPAGRSGGSSGGPFGAGEPAQPYNGGSQGFICGTSNPPKFGGTSAGGGGAGGPGTKAGSGTVPGNGGPGITLDISGVSQGYAGGGASAYAGGTVSSSYAGTATCGGGSSGNNGTDGTGGGASGAWSNVASFKGGSGIVIVNVRYPDAD